jgi:hypothetical protein
MQKEYKKDFLAFFWEFTSFVNLAYFFLSFNKKNFF